MSASRLRLPGIAAAVVAAQIFASLQAGAAVG